MNSAHLHERVPLMTHCLQRGRSPCGWWRLYSGFHPSLRVHPMTKAMRPITGREFRSGVMTERISGKKSKTPLARLQ